MERPILRCVRYDGPRPPVLLIDEIDRADDEFEALLLEALGEGSVTVPELGTFTARRPPIVVLTSNRSRELHDALRRRCLYHWLEYPEPARIVAILRRTAPSASVALIESAARFVGHVRTLDVDKPPGVAEAINWVAAAVRARGRPSWSGRSSSRPSEPSPRHRTTATWSPAPSTPTPSAEADDGDPPPDDVGAVLRGVGPGGVRGRAVARGCGRPACR